MKAIIDKLFSQAMSLPSEYRAQLAEKLVEGLESETIGKLWLSEAIKRRDEVRSGQVTPINGKKALNYVKGLIHNK